MCGPSMVGGGPLSAVAVAVTSVASFPQDFAGEISRRGEAQALLASLSSSSDSCWSRAVDRLQSSCSGALAPDGPAGEARSRLAIRFTNCHLGASGLRTYRCTSNMSIADCTRPMAFDSPSGVAFKTYTSYVTHADNLCYYLQAHEFERRSALTVNALYASTRSASELMASLGMQAGEVAKTTLSLHTKQQEATQSAAALLAGQHEVSKELSALHTRQAAAFDDAEREIATLQARSREAFVGLHAAADALVAKQSRVESLLDRLLDLQRLLLGEVGGVKAVGYYAANLFVTLALTGSAMPPCGNPLHHPAQGRLPALLLLLTNALAERAVVGVCTWANAPAETSWRHRWRSRWLCCVLQLWALIRALGWFGSQRAARGRPLPTQGARMALFAHEQRRRARHSGRGVMPPRHLATRLSDDRWLATPHLAREAGVDRRPSALSGPTMDGCAVDDAPHCDGSNSPPWPGCDAPSAHSLVGSPPSEASNAAAEDNAVVTSVTLAEGDALGAGDGAAAEVQYGATTDAVQSDAAGPGRVQAVDEVDGKSADAGDAGDTAYKTSNEQDSMELARAALTNLQPQAESGLSAPRRTPKAARSRATKIVREGCESEGNGSPSLRTRSGRLSVKPLNFWANEVVLRAADGSWVEDDGRINVVRLGEQSTPTEPIASTADASPPSNEGCSRLDDEHRRLTSGGSAGARKRPPSSASQAQAQARLMIDGAKSLSLR